MSFLHHWVEDELSDESRRDAYVESVDNDPLASLAEIRNTHEDAEYLSAEEFCEQYHL